MFNKNQTALLKYTAVRGGAYSVSNTIASIGTDAFGYCVNLASVTIPDSVTNIGGGAFIDCWSLTNVTIGSGLVKLGEQAFAEDTQLTQVFFSGNAPSLDVFAFVDSPTTLYYLPGATNWTPTLGTPPTPTALWLPAVQTTDGSFGTQTNHFGFDISWAKGQTVVVEASTNLTTGNWQAVQTNCCWRRARLLSATRNGRIIRTASIDCARNNENC